jgi:uncharacterized membrane protein
MLARHAAALMRRAADAVAAPIPPAEAMELWNDLERWPSFVDGFSRVVEVSGEWPTAGSTLVWQSTPGGRGRVEERVEAYEAAPPGPDIAMQSNPGRIVTHVSDESLTGRQTVTFSPSPDGVRVELALEYELAAGGVLQPVTDLLFIRRALRDSLRRTLARFATEAEPR